MSDCSGLIFRGTQSQFFDDKRCSFNYKESFTLLKRESCKCKDCVVVMDRILKGDGDNLIDCNYWFETFKHEPVENGDRYRLKVEKWETGEGYFGDDCYYIEDVKMEKVG